MSYNKKILSSSLLLDSSSNDTQEDSVDNECKICYSSVTPLDDSEFGVQLLCGHRYHYDCIQFSYQYGIRTNDIRMCPYCRQHGGWLPLCEECIPLKYIHREYKKKKKKKTQTKKISDYLQCQAILKSGHKKGTQCTHKKKHGDFCGIHKQYNIVPD